MKAFILALAIICAVSGTLNLQHQDLFVSWKQRYNKEYGTHLEEAVKYEHFFDNYEYILNFNKDNGDVQLALNEFADMTPEEWAAAYLGMDVDNIDEKVKEFNGSIYNEDGVTATATVNVDVNIQGGTQHLEGEPELGANLGAPTSINWVTKGAVTKVKNQICGNCWAYAGAAAMEGYNFIKKGTLINMSPQQLSDCVTTCSGCNGCGGVSQSLQYTAKKGIESLANYPVTSSGSGSCKYSSAKVAIKNTGYKNVQARSVSALKSALAIQPVQVAIQADQRVFQFYSSGVITSNCGSSLNHAILAVGYGKYNGVDAFYVKNQWGTSWGINGYGYIGASATANGGYGVCGILSMAAYPV